MKPETHLWVAALFLAACSPSQPSSVVLPSGGDVPYRVSLKTFKDGAYEDQPFHLMVTVPKAKTEPKTVLKASQCKNVSVAPTESTLHVFYEDLSLSFFSSLQYRSPQPRVRLCDLHFEECAIAQQRLAKSGVTVSNVCSYRTKDFGGV
jgi:hypothetical protein